MEVKLRKIPDASKITKILQDVSRQLSVKERILVSCDVKKREVYI